MDKSKLQNLINSKKVNVSSSLVVNNVGEEKSIANKEIKKSNESGARSKKKLKVEKRITGKIKEKYNELNSRSKKKLKVEHIQRTVRFTGMNKIIFELYEEVNNCSLDNALMSSCLGFILSAEMLAEENKEIEKSLENLRKLVLPHIRKA